MTSFLYLQPCFGTFRSSRKNSKRATIQNLFSKHQHLKTIRRKRSFHPRVSEFSVCSSQFSQLVHFLLQHVSGIYRLNSRVTGLPSIYTALFSLKWSRKITFVPSLKGKWYCSFLMDLEPEWLHDFIKTIKSSKA